MTIGVMSLMVDRSTLMVIMRLRILMRIATPTNSIFILTNIVKDNYQIYKISDSGVNFVGYRIYPNKVILRNNVKRRMIRKSNKLMKKNYLSDRDISSIASYNGILKNITGNKLKQDILEPLQRKVRE